MKSNKKQVIRLTESDLHRIVENSVKKILNEVKFNGESLHGNNPEDWEAMNKFRNYIDQDIDNAYEYGYLDDDDYEGLKDFRHKNYKAQDRDEKNAYGTNFPSFHYEPNPDKSRFPLITKMFNAKSEEEAEKNLRISDKGTDKADRMYNRYRE